MSQTRSLAVPAFSVFLSLQIGAGLLRAAEPVFSKHIIENQLAFIKYRGLHSSLADVNGDRRLDFIVSNFIDRQGPSSNRTWTLQYDVYEYVNDNRWDQKTLMREKVTGSAGNVVALSVGGSNNYSDLALSGSILLNRNGTGWTEAPGARLPLGAHDIMAIDIDNDRKTDITYVYIDRGKTEIAWFKQPAAGNGAWAQYIVDTNPVVGGGGTIHGGIAPGGVCDLNGDGYVDLVSPGRWYQNPGAQRTKPWQKHYMTTDGTASGTPLIGKRDYAWGYMVRSWCADIDRDGDLDIVQSEGDYRPSGGGQGNGRIGWLENTGAGQFRTVHWIKTDREASEPPHDFHSLGIFDYDGDGDPDVFSADGTLPKGGGNNKAVYIFQNMTASKATKPTSAYWKQHTIPLGYECHDAKIGDVNGDGKIDIVCRGYEYEDGKNPVDPPYLFLKNETP